MFSEFPDTMQAMNFRIISGMEFFAVVFTLLNSLQGFFIFLFLIWLNDKNHKEAEFFVQKMLVRKKRSEM